MDAYANLYVRLRRRWMCNFTTCEIWKFEYIVVFLCLKVGQYSHLLRKRKQKKNTKTNTRNFEVEFCWSGNNVKSSIKVWIKLTLARWERTPLRTVGAILIMSISRWQVWHCSSTKIDKMFKCSRVASDLTSVVPLLQYTGNFVSFQTIFHFLVLCTCRYSKFGCCCSQ